MTKEELAALINGRKYRHELTDKEEKSAKDARLVVVFGASDDLMEFRGAINDERGAWNGGEALVDNLGLLPEREQIDSDDDEALKDYFARQPNIRKIEALWCKDGEYSWTFKTDIPHATFEIGESDEEETAPYCRGIVFSLNELK